MAGYPGMHRFAIHATHFREPSGAVVCRGILLCSLPSQVFGFVPLINRYHWWLWTIDSQQISIRELIYVSVES